MSNVQQTVPCTADLLATDHDPFFDAFPPEMSRIREQVYRIVSQDVTLLLTGETGTGKTRLARLIHELSDRRNEPFLVIDCGAVSPSLVESEMFGHVKGAFTGADRDRAGKLAAAGRGTLLLDEINSLPLPLQAKLLRAVDDRTFEQVGSERSQPLRARLIAATNAPLPAEVEAGRFRADLFFRINVVSFFLPPLRQRRSSIARLTQSFFTELAARNRPDLHGLAPGVVRALEDYPWPGNIRELRNIIERAVALAAGPTIQLHDLPEAMRPGTTDCTEVSAVGLSGLDGADGSSPTLAQTKEAAEVLCIKDALARNNNNRLRAANDLGISRMGLYKKLQKYGLAKA
jgi:two-component system, NtrC family, response regulator HydG